MDARTLKTLALVVALTSTTAFSGILPVGDVPVSGTTMRLSDTSGPGGRRNYVVLRDGDPSGAFPDPRVTGATAYIGRVGAGQITALDLPASGWSGGTSVPQDYKFKSRTGVVISARFVAGGSMRFSARGEGAYALGGVPQGDVGIIIDVAGVRFCGFFGGTILRDDGKRFRAKLAPAPASCPVLGTTTTSTTSTSTSSSSTSTSTTSTTTSTTTTSTTLGTADLSLTKVAAPTAVFGAGDPVMFTLRLHNAGPDSGTGIAVTDFLPASFTFSSANPSQGTYTSGVWDVGTLASNADATLGLNVTVTTCAGFAGTTQQNVAEVTAADQTDPDSEPSNQNPSEDDRAIASVFFTCN